MPRALLTGQAGTASGQVLECQRTLIILLTYLRSSTPLENDLSAVHAGAGPHVDQQVRRTDNLFVMLDHYDGIAEVPEPLQDSYQAVGIARMKADGRFVEDVHRAHEGRAEGRHEVDTLAFSARKSIAGTAERQVTQADVPDAAEA